MASVVASVVGGEPTRVEANDVAEAKKALGLPGNYTATVNGEPADDDTVLGDEDFVSLAPSVKGGSRS
jgi:hypothetical protein